MFIVKYLKNILYILIGFLVTILLITIMNYFNIFGFKTIKWLTLLLVIISLFIGGIYIGKESTKKGYLEGLKIGLIIVILLSLLNILINNQSIKINSLLYYLLIIGSTILGSITGINKKLRNK